MPGKQRLVPFPGSPPGYARYQPAQKQVSCSHDFVLLILKMVSGAIQGPEGKDPFILYSLSLLKGSRAIKKTHGCDEFPWLSAAAGWDSRGDEWSGKQSEGRRADWKENEEEKSRGESGIKESEEKTKGGSADCLLFSCRLRFLPCCHGLGFPALPSSLQPPDPILLPAGWGCCPFPSSAHSRTGTQLQGTTAEPVPQPRTQRGPRTNSKIQELQETSRQSVPVHGQGSPVQEVCVCTCSHGRPTTARYNCTCLLQTKQAFIPCWKFPPVESEPLSEDGPVHA